jgi:hypothetical protein
MRMLASAALWWARTGVVEESIGAAMDRGGGGVGRGADRVAARRLRPTEGGGRGGRRWPSGIGLARAVLLSVAVGQRQVLGGRGAAVEEGARAGRRCGRRRRPASGGIWLRVGVWAGRGWRRWPGAGGRWSDEGGGRATTRARGGSKSGWRRQLDLTARA